MAHVSPQLNEWLHAEAHLLPLGPPFSFKNCSCLAISPEQNGAATHTPSGFLLTHGHDVEFVAANSMPGKEVLSVWRKIQVPVTYSELPPECWFG